MAYIYQSAILGGTFDHLHLGHRQLLITALAESAKLAIGVVESPLTLQKSFPASLETYSTRTKNLRSFLRQADALSRTKLIPLHDIYGTSLSDPTIEAIFVTKSTRANADKINMERHKLGFPPLTIIVIPHALGDDQEVISSERIREGIIDSNGYSYLKFFRQKRAYRLPDSLRPILQQPAGTVVTQAPAISRLLSPMHPLICIGDITSSKLLAAGLKPAICVIDYHTRRRKLPQKLVSRHFPAATHHLTNPAGTINPKMATILLSALTTSKQTHTTQIITAAGEEDLLALPAILLSPLNSLVVYGQHNLGMVVVTITPKEKNLVKSYLASFPHASSARF